MQVQYHLAKKRDGRLSARVETLLRDLERDVARRERFLRECARMVGAAPHLEQEVGWRMEHVLTKWDMLAGLRLAASRNNNNSSSSNNSGGGGGGSASDQLPEMYADIELEVRSILNMLFLFQIAFEGCHGRFFMAFSSAVFLLYRCRLSLLNAGLKTYGLDRIL